MQELDEIIPKYKLHSIVDLDVFFYLNNQLTFVVYLLHFYQFVYLITSIINIISYLWYDNFLLFHTLIEIINILYCVVILNLLYIHDNYYIQKFLIKILNYYIMIEEIKLNGLDNRFIASTFYSCNVGLTN